MYEDHQEYASMRLTGTIIQYNNLAAYVDNISKSKRGELSAVLLLPNQDVVSVPLSKLDHTLIPLGYIPDDPHHRYVERVPKRKWKQGHHPENLLIMSNEGRRADALSLKDFQKLLDGNYIPRANAIKNGGAFSRNFCVTGNHLFYKAEVVGTIEDAEIKLFNSKQYMARRLEKTL